MIKTTKPKPEATPPVFIVSYWSQVVLVTSDLAEAQTTCARNKQDYPALPWGVRNVSDAIQHAYEAGFDDGRNEGE
jgi:hypothetical protein